MAGSIEAGPVDPWQPPRALTHTTKYWGGVDRAARPDQVGPPAGRGVGARHGTAHVGVTGEGVTDQHRVGRVGSEGAPGFVGEGEPAERTAALEGEGAGGSQLDEPTVADRVARLPRAADRQLVGVRPRVVQPRRAGFGSG